MIDTGTLSDASRAALAQLRSPTTFNWAIVYILILTGFLYSGGVPGRQIKKPRNVEQTGEAITQAAHGSSGSYSKNVGLDLEHRHCRVRG